MEYKDIQYQIVQTANPYGWKWTVFLDATRARTGISYSRTTAVHGAERAIDNAIKRDKSK